MTPLGFLFLVIMGVLTWSSRPRNAAIPLLLTTCYMPLGQMFVVAGLNLQVFRLLLLVGVLRVLSRREHVGVRATPIDKLFGWWLVTLLVFGTLAEPTVDRFINRCGEAYNALGAYFLFRCWIRTMDDVLHLIRFLTLMIVPLAASMVIEKFTSRNIFAVFGGVPEITVVREGRLRCQGAFRHPILAGTYAATLFPLFAGLWLGQRRDRKRALIGTVCSMVATVAAATSGALLAMMASGGGFVMWRVRYRLAVFRWACVFLVLVLAMVMKAPVWYLIARVSEITGGTGWHRSYLIDQAIRHFGEWWLVGSTYTAHWAPAGQVLAVDPRNMDITNHYVAEGLTGGIAKLGLFIAMIVIGYKSIGHWIRRPETSNFSARILVWSIGVCLTAHCVSFISISYFDQIVVMWYWILAILSLLSSRRATIWGSLAEKAPASPSHEQSVLTGVP